MSTRVAYDPALLLVERAQAVSSRLGEFILGESTLGGAEVSQWVQVAHATFTYSAGYDPDDNGTLIFGSETASVSLSFHGTVGDILYPSDRLKVTYDGILLFTGVVDSTSIDTSWERGVKRIDFSATISSAYAVMMSKKVSWTILPGETALARIQRYVTVQGW